MILRNKKKGSKGMSIIGTIALQTVLLGSTVGIAGLAVIDPLSEGDRLAQLGVAGILGVVAVASVIGLVYVYKVQLRKDDSHTEKLYKLIEEATKAATAQADSLKNNSAILVEVKDAIKDRRHNRP